MAISHRNDIATALMQQGRATMEIAPGHTPHRHAIEVQKRSRLKADSPVNHYLTGSS